MIELEQHGMRRNVTCEASLKEEFYSELNPSVFFLTWLQLTPEEEEKRRVRRERNKLAAAKCRNRRRELTEMLQGVSPTFAFGSSAHLWFLPSF